jgi:diguanylate cyclase (GGDEF)-like protein
MGDVSARLPELVPHDASALFLLDDEGEELRCRIASGVDAEAFQQVRLRIGDGLVGWVARNCRALVNARPAADFEAAGVAVKTMLQSALAVPLMVERCIGVLVLYHARPGYYADAHRTVLDDVADLIAPAIARAVRYEGAMEDVLTDEVTGLPNARFFFMHITRELARAERLGTEVAILVIDLDGFKAIRKRHGRATANRVLREVATEIRRRLRPHDVAIRYENDEFIVTLSGCGREEALEQARELQGAVDTVWIESDGERVPVAGSVGVGVYPHDGRTYDVVSAAAVERMWADKRNRRG